MFKFNNSIVPNKVRIGWHFSSNKYTYRDTYSTLEYLLLFVYITSAPQIRFSLKI